MFLKSLDRVSSATVLAVCGIMSDWFNCFYFGLVILAVELLGVAYLPEALNTYLPEMSYVQYSFVIYSFIGLFFLISLFLRMDSRFSIAAALLTSAACLVLMALGMNAVAEQVAIFSYLWLTAGIILRIVEYFRSKPQPDAGNEVGNYQVKGNVKPLSFQEYSIFTTPEGRDMEETTGEMRGKIKEEIRGEMLKRMEERAAQDDMLERYFVEPENPGFFKSISKWWDEKERKAKVERLKQEEAGRQEEERLKIEHERKLREEKRIKFIEARRKLKMEIKRKMLEERLRKEVEMELQQEDKEKKEKERRERMKQKIEELRLQREEARGKAEDERLRKIEEEKKRQEELRQKREQEKIKKEEERKMWEEERIRMKEDLRTKAEEEMKKREEERLGILEEKRIIEEEKARNTRREEATARQISIIWEESKRNKLDGEVAKRPEVHMLTEEELRERMVEARKRVDEQVKKGKTGQQVQSKQPVSMAGKKKGKGEDKETYGDLIFRSWPGDGKTGDIDMSEWSRK
jgi:hypothetical protein